MLNRRNVSPLNGRWKFKTDPENIGDFQEPEKTTQSWARETTFFDVEFDDGLWEDIQVPANWHTEGYDYNDGIAWYRTRFLYTPDGVNNVLRILFKGVDYFCDAWLNGYYLGSHEGFFQHFAFDVSKWIREGENLLVVKVENPGAPTKRFDIFKGALPGMNWDANDPNVDPGGITNDVALLSSRDGYLERLKATPFVDLTAGTVSVHCKAVLMNESRVIKDVKIGVALVPANFDGASSAIAKSINSIVLTEILLFISFANSCSCTSKEIFSHMSPESTASSTSNNVIQIFFLLFNTE